MRDWKPRFDPNVGTPYTPPKGPARPKRARFSVILPGVKWWEYPLLLLVTLLIWAPPKETAEILQQGKSK